MKVVILAGGFGTRLSEYTDIIPKPMVEIAKKPIIWHIMNHYANYGFKEFVLALGYKSEVIKNYFLNYSELNSDFTINLQTGHINTISSNSLDWKVTLVDTGLSTLTGGRVKRLKSIIGDETFMLTYGDGVSNVNIDKLLDFHQKNKAIVTVTGVRPSARFGELKLSNDIVVNFAEKPQVENGWINGGFFVVEPSFIDLIEGDNISLEQEPLASLASLGKLCCYKHHGFWQCMDTKRDKDYLDSLLQSAENPLLQS